MELLIGGPIVLGYLALTYACATWAIRLAKRRGFGALGKSAAVLGVILVAWAIPLGDHTIGYTYFQRLCQREAGTQIYRTIEKVDGLWWPFADAQTAVAHGYRFVEGGVDRNRVTRFEVVDQKVREQVNVSAISRYVVYSLSREEIGLGISKQQSVVEDSKTSERLSVRTRFFYRGGWLISAILSGYGGTAGVCPKGPFDYVNWIVTVLKPINAKD